MSDHQHEAGGALFGDDSDGVAAPRQGGRRRGRRRSGCLPILLVLVLIGVAGVVAWRTVDIGNPFADQAGEDYPGPGSGAVVFTVSGGDSISVMGQNLEQLGVVASAEAYVDAAGADDASRTIGQGDYRLKKKMKAADVVDLLVEGSTKGTSFTFTAGKTVEEVVVLLAKDTGIARKKYDAALAKPDAIGLPGDDAEGYLAPGSYTFFPDDDANAILSAMVARTRQTTEEVDLAGAAERLGYTEQELLTVASLVEAEGSLLDQQGKAKIARVIYNRLENPTAETVGRLQLDATVNFARGEKVAVPTQAQIDEVADNPYNTYTNTGLPPGPIATPSRAALEAAIEPVDGPWFYYATVNLESGRTKFAVTYDEFLELKAELRAYCATQSDRC